MKLKHMFKAALLATTVSFGAWAEGPAQWELKDEDTTVRILGSIHVLKPGAVWMTENLQATISSAQKIYLELSPEQQSQAVMTPLVQKHGLLPEGDSLKNYLTEEDYEAVKTALVPLGIPEAGFQRFKPWMAATVITAFKFAKVGFNLQSGVEAVIAGQAQARGIPLDGLEQAEDQIGRLAQFDIETQVAFLKSSLTDDADLAKVMNDLTEDWTTADTEALTAFFAASMGSNPVLNQSLLIDRNAEWIPELEAILDQPGNYMVVVGTAHLLGEKSVIQMLKAKGHSIARVDTNLSR